MEIKNKQLHNKEFLKSVLENVETIFLFTSGQILVFDKKNEQISELQKEFTSGETNTELLHEIANHANKLVIGKWREWSQDLTKEEFLKITQYKE